LSRGEAEALLASRSARLSAPDPELGIEVDPAVFVDAGAWLYDALTGADVEVSRGPEGVIVAGDVTLTGTLRQAAGAAPVLVFGDLTAREVISDGYLVVMGDLRVAAAFRGASSNYGTHVLGEARIGALLLEKNHAFVPHRAPTIDVRVEDEVDGPGAVARHLAASRGG
jgi:hypothetical protein